MLPLAGVRVLELSRVLAGPYCAMLLGDLGAEVVKVERPGVGDDTRQWGPPFLGEESAYFLCCNRNKRSVTIDFRNQQGHELVKQLAAKSDVLLENFLPGALDRYGLGYDQLRSSCPRLVYCSITGFGQDGPYRDLPGYDIMIQAMSGVMSITGEPEGSPMKVGVAISDITAGLFAANAILAALVARGTTGEGRRLDIALLDASVAWLANVGANYLATGEPPRRQGNSHASIVPYQTFETSDRSIVVAVGNDGQWKRFCRAIERPDLADDPRFETNPLRVRHRHELVPLLAAILKTRSAEEWLLRLTAEETPCAPVNTLDRTFDDPQLLHRGMLVDVMHPAAGKVRMAGSPIKFCDGAEVEYRPPPRLGEHTDSVLANLLSLSPGAIARLRVDGAI